MSPRYWLDLFTGKTWQEFLEHGAKVSGFRESRKTIASKIEPGDYLICYLTGISRFVGTLEVMSKSYYDTSPIWQDEDFPVRFKVKLITKLTPKTAVPVLELRNDLSIFKGIELGQQWSGFFRGSPAEFKLSDANIIVRAIEQASINPIEREYDERKFVSQPKKYQHTKTTGPRDIPVVRDKVLEEPEEEGSKTQQSFHNHLRDMIVEIGLLEGKISEKEYPLEDGRLDVAWMKISGGKPMAVFEVQVGGNFYQALAKLKHAWDIWNSRPYLVTSEIYRDKAMKWIKGTFHEMEKDLRIIDSDRVEELYNTLKKAKEIKEELGISLK